MICYSALVAPTLLSLGTTLANPLSVSDTLHGCGDTLNVSVRSSDEEDASISCEGAREAIRFLASLGLDVTTEIRIEVVPELTKHASESAAGCYVEEGKRVLILSYSRFAEFRDWFNVIIDRDLYRSLVSHEVAHAVAACNFEISEPSIQAKEYIAYVVQFSTMNAAQRDNVLSQYPGQGFEGDWQMSTTIYLFDPMRFGVQAYRHFLKPGNGRDYLGRILAGKALDD